MRRSLLIALVLGAAACSVEGGAPGSAVHDGGVDARVSVDLGVVDSSPLDGGAADAMSAMDAGPIDGEVVDGGATLGPVQVELTSGRPPGMLSGYNFFRWEGGQIHYNDRVIPYTLNVPLFSDHALKARAIWIPEGTEIEYRAEGVLGFPVGSAIMKSFLFAPDLRSPQDKLRMVETRVMVKYEDGWRTFPYLWAEDQSDAEYFVRGQVSEISFVDPLGRARTAQYLVPQKNQCILCHEVKDEAGRRYTTLIGPRARNLNRDAEFDGQVRNQLEHLAGLGMLSGWPPAAPAPSAFDWSSLIETSSSGLTSEALERAARDYLDINCAHCHRSNATQGITSRLWLNWDNDDEFHLGFCKEPGSAGTGAAGRQFDIVPGDAEASILVYRTETETVGSMMPLLGRSLRDDVAIGVLRGWIDGLTPRDCSD